jgi:hypothetical protein
MFQFLAGISDLYVLHSTQTGSGIHPPSFTVTSFFFWGGGCLFRDLWHLRHESNHSPASSAEPTHIPSWHASLHVWKSFCLLLKKIELCDVADVLMLMSASWCYDTPKSLVNL